MLLSLAELVGAYFLMKYVPRKYVGWTITIFSISLLIFLHLERMINDYGGWHLGIATCFMEQCIHLGGIAWDYTDGGEDKSTLTPEKARNAIDVMPSFLEFFGAALCPTQAFCGPTCNFVDFKDYIYSKGIFASIPNTFFPALKKFLSGSLLVGIYVTLLHFFPDKLLKNQAFVDKNVFEKVFPFIMFI